MIAEMGWASASKIALAVASGDRSALAVTEAALARIKRLNPKLNAFTTVTVERALARAATIDRARRQGRNLCPRAVRGQELVRCRRHPDRRWLQDQPRPPQSAARRHAD